MKQRPGRPSKEIKRDKKVSIYLTDDELAEVEAVRGERDRSTFVRELLLKAVRAVRKSVHDG
jgi:hypothetical protein